MISFDNKRRDLFERMREAIRNTFNRSKPHVHLLHIGKTGGTAVKHALMAHVDGRYTLHLHSHDFRLRDVPVGEKVVFFLRDPVDRFVSGFYSRQRQGRPRYHYPWSAAEAEAFQRYNTADELARSLSSPDELTRVQAEQAMHGIQHVREHFSYWLGDPQYLSSRRQDILFIGFQGSLQSDFEQLCRLLHLPASGRLPDDGVSAHRNPEQVERELSDEAKKNLNAWYAADLSLYGDLKRDHAEV